MDVVADGQIDILHIVKQMLVVDNLEALRRFWEVTATLLILGGYQDITVVDGKGENLDADWQQVLDILLVPSEDAGEDEDYL